MTLVSIITPSYNQASYLEETIRSVIEQEHSPVEYFVVDGGSEDGSVEIIQKYADQISWWVSERDAGQGEAINKGLSRARGEFIAWLNSDDLFLPGAITKAVSVLAANPELGMVFGDAISINEQGLPLNQLTFGDWGLPELMRFRIICQPAVFMRKTMLDKAGHLDPAFHYLLDHHLWIRMARLAPVQHIPEPLAAARHHPAAKNVSQAAAFGQEAMRILEWMEAQTDLAALVQKNRRRIEAGAQRLNARYLLDGGMPGPALKAYGRALVRNPRFTLQHWHRILYALLSLAGGKNLANLYYRRQINRQRL